MPVYALIRFLSDILSALFLQSAIGKLITISPNRLKRFWIFFSCFLLTGMVIFLGDFRNILPTFFFFLITIYIACEGSFFQKTAVGLLFSSTVLAFNTLRDNCLTAPDMLHENYSYTMLTISILNILFSFFLFLGTKIFAPEKTMSFPTVCGDC